MSAGGAGGVVGVVLLTFFSCDVADAETCGAGVGVVTGAGAGVVAGAGVAAGTGVDVASTGVGEDEPTGELSGFGDADGLAFDVCLCVRV